MQIKEKCMTKWVIRKTLNKTMIEEQIIIIRKRSLILLISLKHLWGQAMEVTTEELQGKEEDIMDFSIKQTEQEAIEAFSLFFH